MPINLVKSFWPCLLLLILALYPDQFACADKPIGTAKQALTEPETVEKSTRRVYLLHSGLHTIWSDPIKNSAAETLKEGLHKRGVAIKDLVVLDNPFPTASWRSLVPFESLA